MPIWPISPAQECHRSVLSAGTIGPVSWVAPAAGPDGVLLAGLGGADVVEPDEVQAVTVISAAKPTVSAAALPRTARLPRRGIDMPPIMPDGAGWPGSPRPRPGPQAAWQGPWKLPRGQAP